MFGGVVIPVQVWYDLAHSLGRSGGGRDDVLVRTTTTTPVLNTCIRQHWLQWSAFPPSHTIQFVFILIHRVLYHFYWEQRLLQQSAEPMATKKIIRVAGVRVMAFRRRESKSDPSTDSIEGHYKSNKSDLAPELNVRAKLKLDPIFKVYTISLIFRTCLMLWLETWSRLETWSWLETWSESLKVVWSCKA